MSERQADVVYAALKDAILSGEIPQGTTLSSVRLAERFGVSRTPLREAVRMLQAEGFIDSRPNQRLRVAALSVRELEQLYTLRIALEAVAITITVPRLTADDLAHLRDLARRLEKYAAAKDVDAWEGPHQEFHLGLIAGAGDRVTEEIERLQESSNRYRRLYLTQGSRSWGHTTAEHAAILLACEAMDPVLAAAELARHYARTALTVIALIDPSYDPSSVRTAMALVVPPHADSNTLSPRAAAVVRSLDEQQ